MKHDSAVHNLIRGAAVLAVLLLLIWPAYFSSRIYAWFPFLAVLVLVSVSVILTLCTRRGISSVSDVADMECERGTSVPVSLKIRNNGFLIFPKAVAYLYVSDIYGDTDSMTPAVFSLAAHGVSDFSFDVRMDHIGEFRAGIQSAELYDFLGLFKFPLKIREEVTVAVLPRRREELDFDLSEQSVTESMDQKHSVISDGFDYSGVREYAMGDSMKRIHWKLSAHSPHYMTKLMESSMRNDLAIVLDPSAPPVDRETTASLYDCVVESALSLARTAADREADYQVYYYARDYTVHSLVPRTQEDERKLVRDMAVIGSRKMAEEADGPAILRREAMISGGSSNLILVTACLYEGLTRALTEIRQQGRNVRLVLVLRYDLDSRERESAMLPLNALNEYDISCRVVMTDAPEGKV